MFFALCLNIGIRLIFFLQNSYGPMMTVPAGNWLSRNDLSKFKGAIKNMNSKQSKKLSKQYKKALNAKAQSTLKRTIF